MHCRTNFQKRYTVRLLSCVTFMLGAGMAGAADMRALQGPAAGPIEEIEVSGRRLFALRVEIEGIENRMFDIFNELNDTPAFRIQCIEGIVTGSRIPERECVPRYMKQARMSETQKFLFYDLLTKKGSGSSGGVSMNTKGAPAMTEEQLWFHNNPKHVAFNARFRELAAQHPELMNAAMELQAKRQQLLDSEARQRKETAVGRFFSSFGNNGE
ncbi:MAG: hypothetical protein ACO1PZ_08965 [Gammaproteobacteria bacterium]